MHKRIIDIVEEEGLSDIEFQGLVLLNELLTPLGLHYSAFIPVIQSQGTDEQIAKWVEPAQKLAIMGCYAQTELGHGSNVQGLRTTATLDTNTDEFIIHSPDITAAKWWIGGLGIAATHCVLQAQLIIDGKPYGPHIFIVPVRSPVDRKPVKGVTVGDIGPKAYDGFATVDNGCKYYFALFDNVRIPRENMLMRFAKVTRDGQYIKPVHDKLSYGSMVKLRVGMVADAGIKLGKAATIAIRYCTVRRQFHSTDSKKGELEQQVINYSSVQHRLFPLVAISYALLFAGQSVNADFQKMTKQLLKQDASMLPDMHITTCSLKVWSTRRSTDGQEECRKAMGGHGYSQFSGVGQLFATSVPSNTYEGDNYVLCQQVGRSLLKQLSEMLKAGKPLGKDAKSSYLNLLHDDTPHSPYVLKNSFDILEPQVQHHIFGLRAARLVADLAQQMKNGRPWADVNIECWNICFAHAEYNLVKQFNERVIALSKQSPDLAEPLKLLANTVRKKRKKKKMNNIHI
ncbi:acyl-CoA dehydrogenase/oxidase [Cunninghamella echinulata]|nr:acyl-CoA dehydrogenase/oxidase [Cunninghamella echinulata]